MPSKNVINIDEYRKKQANLKDAKTVAQVLQQTPSSEARLKRIYEKIAKLQNLMSEIRKSTFLKK